MRLGGGEEGEGLDQRRAFPRHLPPVGQPPHRAPHGAQHVDHVALRRRGDGLDERAGVGAALARRAVEGELARRSGVGQQRVQRRAHRVEPFAGLEKLGVQFRQHPRADEGVFAAAVQQQELQLAARAQHRDHPIERDGLERHVHRVLQVRVDGQQVVAPADLDAVPGVEEHHLRAVLHVGEDGAQQPLEAALVEVVALVQREAVAAQQRGHGAGVGHGVVERAGGCVGPVADDDADAPARRFGLRRSQRDLAQPARRLGVRRGERGREEQRGEGGAQDGHDVSSSRRRLRLRLRHRRRLRRRDPLR